MTSEVQTVLSDASHDIKSAGWPGLIGVVMNPTRDLIIAPTIGTAELVVPKVTNLIPFADPIVGMGMRVSSGVVKRTYMVFPHVDSVQTLANRAVEEDSKTSVRLSRNFWLPGNVTSVFFSALGFATNTFFDLLTATGQKVDDWEDTIEILKGFLIHVGKSDLLQEAFQSPRLIRNCIIISSIQNKLGLGNQKRADQAAFNDKSNPYRNRKEFSSLLDDGRKYMKYATAAYGAFQVMAMTPPMSRNTTVNDSPPEQTSMNGTPVSSSGECSNSKRVKLIESYLGLDECFTTESGKTERVGEIVYMTGAGGDTQLVGYFVAVNNVEKAVVLAVRGTYSISDVMADVEAQSIPFCGGRAHKGIADRATYLWNHVKPTLDQVFRDHRGYKLVLTGHSLGGGVSNLINIIIHENNYHPRNQVVCYGFASPPSFKIEQPSDAVKQAIAVSNCFVTEDDTVPFLSAFSVFRLAQTLTEVDNFTKRISLIDRILIAQDPTRAPPNLIEVVRNAANDLQPDTGYEKLEIAAKAVFWMRRNDGTNWKAPVVCNPTLLATRPIYVSQNMITNHFPTQYEESTNFS